MNKYLSNKLLGIIVIILGICGSVSWLINSICHIDDECIEAKYICHIDDECIEAKCIEAKCIEVKCVNYTYKYQTIISIICLSFLVMILTYIFVDIFWTKMRNKIK